MERWAGRQVDLEDREEQRRNKATFDGWYNTLILPTLFTLTQPSKTISDLKTGAFHWRKDVHAQAIFLFNWEAGVTANWHTWHSGFIFSDLSVIPGCSLFFTSILAILMTLSSKNLSARKKPSNITMKPLWPVRVLQQPTRGLAFSQPQICTKSGPRSFSLEVTLQIQQKTLPQRFRQREMLPCGHSLYAMFHELR